MGLPLSASPKKGGTGFEPGKETDKFMENGLTKNLERFEVYSDLWWMFVRVFFMKRLTVMKVGQTDRRMVGKHSTGST